jgi:hypothetical protein
VINDIHERLTNELLMMNDSLSYAQARTWIELLWEDFETTQAKAGYPYRGFTIKENIVRGWIKNYGPKLHEFVTKNTRFSQILNTDNHLMH